RAVAADQEQAYTVAGELLRATLAYWELRGAQERLSVVLDAAERSADVRGIIARLVAARERAAADEAQAAAFVADRLTDVAVARQDLWERAAVLGTACGVPAARFREAHFAQEVPAAALPTARLRSVDARPDLAARRALLRAERI